MTNKKRLSIVICMIGYINLLYLIMLVGIFNAASFILGSGAGKMYIVSIIIAIITLIISSLIFKNSPKNEYDTKAEIAFRYFAHNSGTILVLIIPLFITLYGLYVVVFLGGV